MNRANEIYKAAQEYCGKNIPNLQDIPHTIETVSFLCIKTMRK